MHQIIHAVRVRRAFADTNAARPVSFRAPDGVVENFDAVRIPKLDAAVCAAGDEVVADDSIGDVARQFAFGVGGGLAGIAEAHAAVAIHDQVSFHDNILRTHPDENG